jgi:hypothetical protein
MLNVVQRFANSLFQDRLRHPVGAGVIQTMIGNMKKERLRLRRLASAENVWQGTFSRTGFDPLLDNPHGGELFDYMANVLDYEIQKLEMQLVAFSS